MNKNKKDNMISMDKDMINMGITKTKHFRALFTTIILQIRLF